MSAEDRTGGGVGGGSALWTDERFGEEFTAALTERAGEFRDRSGQLVTDVVRFAAAAFNVAYIGQAGCYLRGHRRVRFAHWDWTDRAAARPVLRLELAVPAPDVLVGVLDEGCWPDWEHKRFAGREYLREPYESAGAFTTFTMRIPLEPGLLPDPVYRDEQPDPATAKAAVAQVCRQVSVHAGPVLAALEGATR